MEFDKSRASNGGPASAIAGWGAVLVACGIGLASCWPALVASLWLDELHTAWTVAGPVEEVLPRGAQGNQLPVYFWWQWCLAQTVGHSELALRASSLMAWVASLSLIAVGLARLAKSNQHWFLTGLIALLALDRNQMFFATEARPYALLALLNLVAWWQLAVLVRPGQLSTGRLNTSRAACWMGVNGLAFWLQPVAVLAWIAQMAALAWIVVTGGQRGLAKLLLLAAVVQVFVALPACWVLAGTWQARSAWSAFAADVRLSNLLRQMPLIAVLVPLLIASLLSLRQRPSTRKIDSTMSISPALWFCAWAIPLALAAVLSATKFAPLMHPRYLFASSSLLVVWAAVVMYNWSNKCGWLTVLAMMVTLTLQQGTLSAWSHGRLAPPVRSEDWRGLSHTLARATVAETVNGRAPIIYCAAGLIEGNIQPAPDDQPQSSVTVTGPQNEYLSFPLRSIYAPEAQSAQGQPAESQAQIVALLNDPQTWQAEMGRRASVGKFSWLVVRCSVKGLAGRLERAGLKPLATYDFGGVQLVRFQE